MCLSFAKKWANDQRFCSKFAQDLKCGGGCEFKGLDRLRHDAISPSRGPLDRLHNASVRRKLPLHVGDGPRCWPEFVHQTIRRDESRQINARAMNGSNPGPPSQRDRRRDSILPPILEVAASRTSPDRTEGSLEIRSRRERAPLSPAGSQ